MGIDYRSLLSFYSSSFVFPYLVEKMARPTGAKHLFQKGNITVG